MTGLFEKQDETTSALGLSDLANLADSLADSNFPEAAATKAKPRPENRVPPAARADESECRPVALDGLFAILHPECAKAYVDQFHQLRTQLMLYRSRMVGVLDVRTIAVMSTHRGEGKSFTATNLAATLANCTGQAVLLVDANREGRELPTGIDGLKPGLGQALQDPAKWEQSVYRVKDSTLSIMPRGRVAGRAIDFGPLPRLLAQVRKNFEWVILDGASFASSPDAEWLSSVVDGTLLVAQGGTAKFEALKNSLWRIPEDRMAGVVFNERPVPTPSFRARLRFSGKWGRAA